VATENIEFVPPSVEDQGLVDASLEGGVVPGPEVRPDGRPPRVKANILSKPSGQKDQRTRIPVSTEIPVQFESVTDLPEISLDFAPPPVSASPVAGDEAFKSQNKFFNRPSASFPTRRPDVPRVKSNILANQRNHAGNAKSRPKIPVPAGQEDPRTTGDRVVPVNELESPVTPAPGVENFLAQVPLVPLDEVPLQPQFVDEIDEFEDPADIDATTFLPPTPLPGSAQQPRVKSNILAGRQNKFNNNNNNRLPVTPRPAFSGEVGSSEAGFEDEDGSACSNPFKCPPSKVADGRKPRVKSNIKAVHRNFFVPNRNTNRIKGKVKQDRTAFNQFLTNLRGRKGKASRERPKQQVCCTVSIVLWYIRSSL
jgi:hypothetical protein